MPLLPEPPCAHELADVREDALRIAIIAARRQRLAMNGLVAAGVAAVVTIALQTPDGGIRDLSLPELAIGLLGLCAVGIGYKIGFFYTDPPTALARRLIELRLAPLTDDEVQSLRHASLRAPALAEAVNGRLAAGVPLYTRDMDAAVAHLRALGLPLPHVEDDLLRLPELAAACAS